MATSSRSIESIYAQHKRQRRANFLAGPARSGHKLPQSLETTFSTAQTNISSTHQQSCSCKRGCPEILHGLKAAFDVVGHHPAKSHQQRLASYPLPKKQKTAHRSISSNTHDSWLVQYNNHAMHINNSFSHTHKAQNHCLRQNITHAHGNLLFCRQCLGIHTTQRTRQHIIKQKQKDQPIVELTKRRW